MPPTIEETWAEAQARADEYIRTGSIPPRSKAGEKPHAGNVPRPDANETETAAEPRVIDSWPDIDEAMFHGLPGEFVKAIGPHTEADLVGILIHTLVAFGNIIGNAPYYQVESSRHHANLFACSVGKSARSRKGTGAGRVMAASQIADEQWYRERTASGLSSGEGLIDSVRDAVEKWNAKEQTSEVVDPGVSDKRLFVIEEEFAGALAAMERHGNKLSSNLRDAWDGKRLQTMTRSAPLKAPGAHISIAGHITREELRARLTRTDMANGFANRFLFALVRKSKSLPHGGHFPDEDMRKFGSRIAKAAEFARKVGRVRMTDAAATAWSAAYADLSSERPGLLGAVTARAEAQTIRLAMIYALFDHKDTIDIDHLEAAIALWAYCDESATVIFGDSIGDPVADDILAALRNNVAGMTRTDISNLFGRNRDADQIGRGLAALLRLGLTKFETTQTSGRPAERWFAIGGGK